MNREQYIEYRKSGRLSPIAWDYYKNNVEGSRIKLKTPLTLETFNRVFARFYQMVQFNWNELFELYDKKFNVHILHNVKTNKIYRIT